MGGATLNALMLGALALLLVSAGIEDVRTREIANWKNATIALLAPLWWWLNGLSPWPDLAIQLGMALAVFAFFWAMFHFGGMGGGDVKMIGALALWFPFEALLWMLIIMSLVGGALTLLLLIERAARRKATLRTWVVLIGINLAYRFSTMHREIKQRRALHALVLRQAREAGDAAGHDPQTKGIEIPYGVAIAIAALISLPEPFLNHFL